MSLVSVIIPAYNVENYIEECIESVLNQSLKDVEIICVDDGSKDNTRQVLESIKDTRLKCYYQENKGVSAARNYGLKMASGKYIMFLDSDDKLASDTIETVYQSAEENNCDIVDFGVESFYENEQLADKFAFFKTYYNRKGQYEGVYDGKQYFNMLMDNNDFRASVCLHLIKKSILDNQQLRFEEGIIHEDNLFIFQMYLCVNKAMYLDKPFYLRRVRDGSIMTTKTNYRNVYGYFKCALLAQKFVEKAGIDQLVIKNAERRIKYMYNKAVGTYRKIKDKDQFKSVLTKEEYKVFFYSAYPGFVVSALKKKLGLKG